MTDYGSDVDEIRLMKVSNYKPDSCMTNFSIGLYKDIKSQLDLVKINGKPFNYRKNGNMINFNKLNCYNNQYIEVHLKYKYYTNEEKDLYRKEKILLSYLQNSYVKSVVQIPDEYFVVGTDDIFIYSKSRN